MPVARSRRRVAAAAAVALLAGALTAWVTGAGASLTPDRPVARATLSGAVPPSARGLPERAAPMIPSAVAKPSPAPDATPSRLEIPSIDVRMPLRPVALDPLGDMQLPPSPQLAGWYRFGPAPGSGSGAVVLAAHLDAPRYGVGPLAALEQLQPGARVVVQSGDTAHRYRVASVRRIGKGELDLDSLFARDGPPRLHIVTCGGDFDRRTRQYQDNVVALAVPE